MEVANLYDNGPISPIARIKENLSIWSENKWKHFIIDFIEPIPRSSPMTMDLCAIAGVTTIAANGGQIPKQIVPILQVAMDDLLHLRWEPLDDVDGLLWQLSGRARNETRGAHARVSMMSGQYDPYLAASTFWVLGGPNLDVNIGARNPRGVAQPSARFAFFGYRYILTALSNEPVKSTYLPAQGK